MFIVCDIGGTKTRIARADVHGLQSEPVIFGTPQKYDVALKLLQQHIVETMAGRPLQSLIIGVAGSLHPDKRGLYKAPHLPDWSNKPLRDDLSTLFRAPVLLENDVALVGLGEAVYGAGREAETVAYMSFGTGVGGVRIVDKDIEYHTSGFEPGHHIIHAPLHEDEKDEHRCLSCTFSGHWEAFIGGASLHKKYHGVHLHETLDDKTKDMVARFTAYGIYNTLLYWPSDCVVLGGGLVMHDVIKIDRVKRYLEKCNTIIPTLPPLIKSELHDTGGLYGGVAYIKKRF